jgi:D-ribose pyranose/furanose isomerase RbsD
MKTSGIVNGPLAAALASLRHTDLFVISDGGFPAGPRHRVIDLSIVPGSPRLRDVLSPVLAEVALEASWIAVEAAQANPEQSAYLGESCPSEARTARGAQGAGGGRGIRRSHRRQDALLQRAAPRGVPVLMTAAIDGAFAHRIIPVVTLDGPREADLLDATGSWSACRPVLTSAAARTAGTNSAQVLPWARHVRRSSNNFRRPCHQTTRFGAFSG